jgi:large subunit ribosomal protein L47
MEFFDDKKNWNENEVKHGRSWLLPELRIKSNTDLHKLWYILLKERNMLKTMEHQHKAQWVYWASPERIDKVEESMANIETVVRERNTAYYQLEVGHKGERPEKNLSNVLGIKALTKLDEYPIPFHMNKEFQRNNPRRYAGFAVRKFLRRMKEKESIDARRARTRDRNHVIRLLSRFPDTDRKLLAEKYPSVNLAAIEMKNLHKGHYEPKFD